MKLKNKVLPVVVVLSMVVSFMSGYEVFYGSVRSPIWYLLYFGKYFLALFFIVLSYANYKKEGTNIFIAREYSRLFLVIPFVILVYSLIIWFFEVPSFDYISRGISTALFKSISYAGGIAIAYRFKKDALKYGIYAALITYSIAIVLGALRGGTDFFKTALFFRETAAQGAYTELHEVAFVIGLYLIFLLFINKDRFIAIPNIMVILCGIYFVIAWKRIGIAAFLVIAIYLCLIRYKNKIITSHMMRVIGMVAIGVCILYVALIASSNGLVSLMESYGINLMGRNIIYNYFRGFCEFHVNFMGHGIGFVSRQFDYTTAADLYNMISIKALHNDLMKMFIEIGFIGFIIWCWYWLIKIPNRIEKIAGTESAFYCLSLILFAFMTYTTDNTEGYFNFQLHLIMLITIISSYYQSTEIKERRD